MPRVKSLDIQTRKEREIKALIAHRMELLDKDDHAIAEYLSIHVKTFRRKRKNPSRFTLLEMQRLARYLEFKESDKVACL